MEDGISGGLQHHHETCCEKGGRRRRQACMVQRWFHYRNIVSRQVDLYMTALSNVSLIVRIHLVIHKILANKVFTVTDGLISQFFVVAFIHPTYV